MSFHLLTGLMGGGKSYAGVEMALKAAREGAIIHTNLPLVQEEWEKLELWDRIIVLPKDPRSWIRFDKVFKDGLETEIPSSDIIIGGAEGRENLVIYDEASIVFRTKDQAKNKDIHQPVFDLIALSRHVGLEIHFLAQHHDNISVDLRRLAQSRMKCIKAAEIPMIGSFAARFFGDFRRVLFKGQGDRPYMHSWHRFKPSIGALYKTHGMAESVAMRVDATRSTKGMDAAKKKGFIVFIGGPLLCLLLFFGALWRAKSQLWDAPREKARIAEEAKRSAKAPAAAGLSNRSSESAPAPTPKKRGGLPDKTWDKEDELIYAGRFPTRSGPSIRTREGYSLFVGGSYEGEPIIEYMTSSGWHYFITAFDRTIVVRPLRHSERIALPPVTGSQPQENTRNQNEPTPMTPITQGLEQLKDQIRGT